MNNRDAFGNNITEVITVKEKVSQMFKDKLFLVMMVLGLLTIVAAAGVATMQKKGTQQNPYLEMQDQGNLIAEEPMNGSLAGESNAQIAQAPKETKKTSETENRNQDTAVAEQTYEVAQNRRTEPAKPAAPQVQEAGSGLDAATALVLDFSENTRMKWPVEGNVLLDYSMDSTIYFPTLDQYKCNPGIVIQGEVSTPVYAPANARVMAIGVNEEIGNFVTLDLGNDYNIVCGQLKELAVDKGEYLEKGQLLGYVAEPTKYYSIEGSNIYIEMMHQGKNVDPLDFME